MKILKKLTLVLTIVAILVATGESFAQNPNKNSEKQTKIGVEKGRVLSFEKIKSMKIAFFTDKLSLTSEEAERFWPVYNACEKEAFEARRETMKAQKALKEAYEKESGKSDSEIKKLVELYYACIDKENAIAKENFVKYQKVLPIKKAAMIRVLDEQFLHDLVGRMKHDPNGKPQKQN